MFNCSFHKGVFAAMIKKAFITPGLKKIGLNATSVNLSVLSILLEHFVACQLMEYLSLADLLPPLQSGFRQGHSTETAVLRVLWDIFQAVEHGDLAALVLLYLSAAFDMIKHSILLQHLPQTYGIGDTALCWFQSNLSSRRQYVRRGLNKLSVTYLVCSLRQGSVL